MRVHLALFLLCVPSFVCAELRHSLGVDVTDYDDHIESQQREFELDTQQYGLSYAVSLESGMGFSLSGWQSAADTNWSATILNSELNAQLEREQQGLQLGASLPASLWFSRLDADANYRLALTYAESDAETWLHFDNGNQPYREQVESWSLGASLARDWAWQALVITPMLGLTYQELNSSLWQQVQFRRGRALNLQQEQEDKGWSAEAGISLAYDIETSAQWLLSPYADLNWFEPLTLDSAVSQTSTLQRGTLSRSRSSLSTDSSDADGSGVYALGVYTLWQDWSADLSWSDTWASDVSAGAQLRFGLSRSF